MGHQRRKTRYPFTRCPQSKHSLITDSYRTISTALWHLFAFKAILYGQSPLQYKTDKELQLMFTKKRLLIPVVLVLVVAVADVLIINLTHGESGPIEVSHPQNTTSALPGNELSQSSIKVMTLNMAHGRADGRNQILQSGTAIRNNIHSIGALVAREDPQVIAMQEADAPSWWSGNFSHVESTGNAAGMTSVAHALNIDGLGLHYGTAIATQLEVTEAQQVTFPRNLPSFSKGFVVATCVWPGDDSFKFDVVSLHLDFASHKVRSRQLAQLAELVKQTPRPMILMGDFNTDMAKELLPNFLKNTGLTAWRSEDQSIVTFPIMKSRIDWILVSPEFHITSHKLIDEQLSDHRFVAATLTRAN